MVTRGPRATVITGTGRGAIAVIRVWGEGAVTSVDRVFRPGRGSSFASTVPGRPRVGRIGAGLGDEVVALIEAGSIPEVEIQCHGGPVATSLVLDALKVEGARLARPESWLWPRAGSRSKAEAHWLLARAETTRTAEILFDQAEGAFDRAMEGLQSAAPEECRHQIATLLARAEVGLRLVEGWRVVLAGRPNVGKSRLLNALAGFQRAIVDPTPGTTRDIVTARTAFDGWSIELSDTAGLRETTDTIESQGVERARARQADADLVIVVLDRSEPLTPADREVMALYPAALFVANKADRPAAWDAQGLSISAERGDGIEELIKGVAHRLVPDTPPPGEGVPFRRWQVRQLHRLAHQSYHL